MTMEVGERRPSLREEMERASGNERLALLGEMLRCVSEYGVYVKDMRLRAECAALGFGLPPKTVHL